MLAELWTADVLESARADDSEPQRSWMMLRVKVKSNDGEIQARLT